MFPPPSVSAISRAVLYCKVLCHVFHSCLCLPLILFPSRQGRRPRGWGNGPPKFEVGDGPCIGRSNILRSSVIEFARKYEHKGIFFRNSGCSCEEMVIYDIEHSKRYEKSGKRNGKSEKPGQ